MLRKALILFIMVLMICYVRGQNSNSEAAEKVIADIFEQLSENSDVEIDFSDFYAEMMSYAENPININNVTKDALEKLQFLSAIQIDNILYYLYRFGPLETIYELQLIEGLDMTDIQLLLPFVKLGSHVPREEPLDLQTIFKQGKSQVYLRLDKGLEMKEGYRLSAEETPKAIEQNNKKYVGDPIYGYSKYRFRFRDRVAWGITGEKDAGEQLWGAHTKGYDFYSAHIELKDFGRLKKLIVGDYRANFGLGLAIHTDFLIRKSSYVLQINPRTRGLRKFTGTDEYNFFRGAGISIDVAKANVSAFYSNNKIDGDTAAGQFTSVKKDGLHRTLEELQRKRTVRRQVAGFNATLSFSQIQLGATVVYTALEHPIIPTRRNYNQFYFQGKNQFIGSVNYRLKLGNFHVLGETAHSNRTGEWATINATKFHPTSNTGLVALYRYFSKTYDPMFGAAFAESSRINNESGFYIGVEVRPIKYWKLSAYVDSYRFPWLKSGIDAPSVGKDFLAQVDYAPRRTVNMYCRFKFEKKAGNFSDTAAVMSMVMPRSQWSIRYRLDYSFGRFQFKNQLDINGFEDTVNSSTYGYSAIQDIGYKFLHIPLGFDIRLQVFDAPHFSNRIYIYEKDVLYAFSTPMFYGMGTRYYVNLRYTPNKHLSIWFKLAQTTYADGRITISNNNEMIQGRRKTDLRVLLRFQW